MLSGCSSGSGARHVSQSSSSRAFHTRRAKLARAHLVPFQRGFEAIDPFRPVDRDYIVGRREIAGSMDVNLGTARSKREKASRLTSRQSTPLSTAGYVSVVSDRTATGQSVP
jgi:hypothetical protein